MDTDKKRTARRRVDSPLGPVEIAATESGLSRLRFLDAATDEAPIASPPLDDEPSVKLVEHLDRTERELDAYFAGTLRSFTVPLAPEGTPFQSAVWRALGAVPFGGVTVYGEIARTIGKPRGSQAVGLANGRNPIAIIIPCHRVVGKNGKLTGYAGGIERKKWLLRHESSTLL
ncbi:methylated-DNA--[protein]-cysteine S-methyltransferase [Lewinella sp. JB7]|uniref:methylated-DNA--[protein]-cysteine S-methyltransferase n=1 Tax=Lewinella sp. JB7 TaxID=2962887 RepID=UPI0020C9BDBB|nr:methylated-DNA--[protein]-cysteine S-methyltransferase [Lewinella sp. JB7]MCP9237351.1 methylated-DNA--[protein]-cysteine S-methyltransferase [Lewinella sp. JB7]